MSGLVVENGLAAALGKDTLFIDNCNVLVVVGVQAFGGAGLVAGVMGTSNEFLPFGLDVDVPLTGVVFEDTVHHLEFHFNVKVVSSCNLISE